MKCKAKLYWGIVDEGKKVSIDTPRTLRPSYLQTLLCFQKIAIFKWTNFKIRLFINYYFILGIWRKLFPKKKPIGLELEDSFVSDIQMKDSPIKGEPDKAVAPQLLPLDEIKTEPDNTQVNNT